MTTDMSGGPGAFRRLMNKVATWSEALNYSGIAVATFRIRELLSDHWTLLDPDL